MMRDDRIHKLMLSTGANFNTAKEAEDYMHDIAKFAIDHVDNLKSNKIKDENI